MSREDQAFSSFEDSVQRTMQAIVAEVDGQDDEEDAEAAFDAIVGFVARRLGEQEALTVMGEAVARLQDERVVDEIRALGAHFDRA